MMRLLLLIVLLLSLHPTAFAQDQDDEDKLIATVRGIIQKIEESPFPIRFTYQLFRYEHPVEEYLNSHLDSAEAWYCLGFIKSVGLIRGKAEAAFLRAIELKPDFAEAYRGLALHYKSPSWCGNFAWTKDAYEAVGKKALVLEEKAVSLKPDYAIAYVGVAGGYESQQRYKEAIQAYEKAIALNSKLFPVGEYIGTCYESLNQYEQAINAYQQTLNSYEQYGSTLTEHESSLKVGLDFGRAGLLEKIASVYTKQKRHQDALKVFQQIVDLKLDHSTTHLQIGLLHLILGDLQAAQEKYELLLRMSQNEEDDLSKRIIKKEAQELLNQIRQR